MLSLLLVPFLVICVFFYIRKGRGHRFQMPPGPPKDPIIGHLRHMPSAQSALRFHEMAKTYGDVMHLEILGEHFVILDSRKAAIDLLETRGAIYSDRPQFPLYELLGWKNILPLMPYGKQFAHHRQMHQNYLSRQKCLVFKPVQMEQARQLVLNLATSPPKQYRFFLNKFSIGVIVHVVSGHKIESDDDLYLQVSKMVFDLFQDSGIPRGTSIDLFPFLKHLPRWFPGAYYVGFAQKWRSTVQKLYDYPFETVQRQRKSGQTVPSFLLSHLEDMENGSSSLNYEELKGAATAMFLAGEATTWGAITVFVLAMVLYPECQTKAQNEIESVIGTSRLPTFDDRERLPYINCVLRETLRWNPALQQSVPHLCTQDDFYRGMYIPKGTIVLANIQGMALDEKIYTSPTAFIPERFLPKPVGFGEPYFESGWGFGRRTCTGQHLADNSLWIAIATILATCKISNAVDKQGNIIVPECIMSDGISNHPKDFECTITPRFPLDQLKELLDESGSAA